MKANTAKYLLVLFPVLISGCTAANYFRFESKHAVDIGQPVQNSKNRYPEVSNDGTWIGFNIRDTALVLLESENKYKLFSLAPGDSFFASKTILRVLVADKRSETIRIALAPPERRPKRYRFSPMFIPRGEKPNLWNAAVNGGNLTIETDADTEVQIGGRKIGMGSAHLMVRPGKYSIRVQRTGFVRDEFLRLSEDDYPTVTLYTRQTRRDAMLSAGIPGLEQLFTGNRSGFLTEFGLFSSSLLLTVSQAIDTRKVNKSDRTVQMTAGGAGLLLSYGLAWNTVLNQSELIPPDPRVTPELNNISFWEYEFNGENK